MRVVSKQLSERRRIFEQGGKRKKKEFGSGYSFTGSSWELGLGVSPGRSDGMILDYR